ncbi:hypothetical protein [Atopobacter sp. AH10]|uniref:hypothetical protein n=1 Tax=Atopobacter sp. AH10 TaxID=2315861 RepID=UPI00131466D2|nr:hypothetical protein [Atopobacter sp. AH10]
MKNNNEFELTLSVITGFAIVAMVCFLLMIDAKKAQEKADQRLFESYQMIEKLEAENQRLQLKELEREYPAEHNEANNTDNLD